MFLKERRGPHGIIVCQTPWRCESNEEKGVSL